MMGSVSWPEAAIWIALILAISAIFVTTIWQLGRVLIEHLRRESEFAHRDHP